MYRKMVVHMVMVMYSFAVLTGGCAALKPVVSVRRHEDIPSPQREFRAAWVATVVNIDWPSTPGLSSEEQKKEIIAILDRAQDINLNAVIFQVRPQCDAFYPSVYEPWSYYLSGQQGKAPDPFYDPLAMWIEEAHDRGMELHVWFNPYRAHHPKGGEITETSVVTTHPELVKQLKNGYWWLDPAKKETQDHSIEVIMDVVRRYDIDGTKPQDKLYPGDKWILKTDGIEVQSWYCEPK